MDCSNRCNTQLQCAIASISWVTPLGYPERQRVSRRYDDRRVARGNPPRRIHATDKLVRQIETRGAVLRPLFVFGISLRAAWPRAGLRLAELTPQCFK